MGGHDQGFLMPRDFTLHLDAGNGQVTTRKAGQFLVGEGRPTLSVHWGRARPTRRLMAR